MNIYYLLSKEVSGIPNEGMFISFFFFNFLKAMYVYSRIKKKKNLSICFFCFFFSLYRAHGFAIVGHSPLQASVEHDGGGKIPSEKFNSV